ncbi:hypothetical protein OUQ99_31480 (plasmid) [Streptomonospora nanhaiensis]|uniref:Uncharacterized protein n=1 Tax=Streptomonospora nanhaiensis TaxID=1323731 RepID=A0ABY6YWT9_9ACTN|nr:hypothetical protein [Streptomonospora nanhaiensis]WAE76832.1 hypothetical protein OUQ99_31480 [Streptomonospora nanhaiensis]
MNTPYEQCDHWVVLDDRVKRMLTGVPQPHHFTPVDELSCSLQIGHEGQHYALGQSGGDPDADHQKSYVAFWYHWGEAVQGMAFVKGDRNTCGAQGRSWRDPDDEEIWKCAIPPEHGGAHDWQIEYFTRELTPRMEEWVLAYEAQHV